MREFAAFSEEDFVRVAVERTRDLRRLAEIRAELRGRMEKSSLMDAPLFVSGLEGIYRRLWTEWCAAHKRP